MKLTIENTLYFENTTWQFAIENENNWEYTRAANNSRKKYCNCSFPISSDFGIGNWEYTWHICQVKFALDSCIENTQWYFHCQNYQSRLQVKLRIHLTYLLSQIYLGILYWRLRIHCGIFTVKITSHVCKWNWEYTWHICQAKYLGLFFWWLRIHHGIFTIKITSYICNWTCECTWHIWHEKFTCNSVIDDWEYTLVFSC